MSRLLLIAAIGIFAMTADARDAYVPSSTEVLQRLSDRSGLSEADLKSHLADCNVDQTAMYFCAYRDVVSADLKLGHAVAERSRRLPACKRAFEAQVAAWRKNLIPGCARSARKEWDGGSMEPTAAALCQAFSTNEMTAKIRSRHACRPVPGR